jgi:hypothetical protein
MENREQVERLVQDGVACYEARRNTAALLARARQDTILLEQELNRIEAECDSIIKKLRSFGFHDVGHAKGELGKGTP